MDIFESLENLNVSEECFDDIMDIVEDIVTYARKKEGDSHLSPSDSSLSKAYKRHKDLLAQAKGVRRHFNKERSKKGWDDNINYSKLDDHVEHEKNAVDTLNKLISNGDGHEVDVKDVLSPEGWHKQYLKNNKNKYSKGTSSLSSRAKKLFNSIKRPHDKEENKYRA